MVRVTTALPGAVACVCASVAFTSPVQAEQTGVASYYGGAHQGRRTASGERFNMAAMTAAHRTFPFGTRLQVTNLANGRAVTVRINDRGPFSRGRVVDVSMAAARALGMMQSGTARVRLVRTAAN